MKKKYSSGLIPLLFLVSSISGQSYSLEECVHIALQNKETVQIATINVKSAIAGKKRALSNIMPSLRVNSGWNKAKFPERNFTIDPITGEPVLGSGGATISSLTTWSGGVNLNQTLYDGGGWWNRIARARNNYLISQQRERQARIDVVLLVHQTYFRFLKAQQLLKVADLSLELAVQQVKLVRRQFALGAVKKTDLLKAEVRKGQAHVDLVNQKSEVRNALFALNNAMGLKKKQPQFTVKDSKRPLRPIPKQEEAYQLLTKNNPALLALQALITEAEINRKLARADRLPALTANVNYSASSDDLSSFTSELDESWRLNTNISLSIPLFTGFNTSRKIQQARLTVSTKEKEYSAMHGDLINRLEAIFELLRNYHTIIPINEEILVSAEEDQKLVQKRYSLGLVTILEVLDAQVSVIQTRSNLVSLRYDARIQEANLLANLGVLDEKFN